MRTVGRTLHLAAVGCSSPGCSEPGRWFQPIHELWDAGRVARHRDVKAACRHDVSTPAIETCYEDRAENADVAIDAVRSKVLTAKGTAVGIEVAHCLFEESAARPGRQYVFDIDYSPLAKDPGAARGTGRFE
ncbi:MAG: hypothetical protein ACYDEN_12165 [Acidimicrobiales bacterium]